MISTSLFMQQSHRQTARLSWPTPWSPIITALSFVQIHCKNIITIAIMAEVLGVVASGISVVSFAIQLAESIQKLRAFYSLVREAPTEILHILDELETQSLILENIEESTQGDVFLDPRTKLAVNKSFRLCTKSGEALKTLAKELEDGIDKGKKRGGFKMALKKDKIEEIRKRLESSKATMSLAIQCYNSAIQRQNWESHELDMIHMKAIVGQMSGLMIMSKESARSQVAEEDDGQDQKLHDEASPRREDSPLIHENQGRVYYPSRARIVIRQSGMKLLLGTFDIAISQRRKSTTTSISLNIPDWISARRYQICFKKSQQGWDQSFRTYRTVPLDAKVFDYCMAGDLTGLQYLFESGFSSPFEIDPEGRTPLHVSQQASI
jgi:ribosomal protein L7/L12